MNYKKESLEKLIVLIKEICESDENQWFKEKLFLELGLISTNSGSENNFGSYFNLLKKQFKIKAKKLYENINDKDLKKQLINDCVKMYWYQVNNDVNQMFVYAFYQLENMLNYYIKKSDCFSKIINNRNFYTLTVKEKFIVNCSLSFLGKEDEPKEVEKINIWAKIVYWGFDNNKSEFVKLHNQKIFNLISIRNLNSHRDSKQFFNEQQINGHKRTIDSIRLNDYSSFGYYMNILREIIKSLEIIDGKVKDKPIIY